MSHRRAEIRLVACVLSMALIAAGCTGNASTTTPETGTFEGHYVTSFEVSSFVPCSMPGLPGYGEGYWLEATRESNFFKEYEDIVSSTISSTTPIRPEGVIVFVRFVGDVSPEPSPGSLGYGHLNQYAREITVTQLLEMDPHTGRSQCRG